MSLFNHLNGKVEEFTSISKVTNNGRTTEGEYRVALPDGRVQVTIFHNEDLYTLYLCISRILFVHLLVWDFCKNLLDCVFCNFKVFFYSKCMVEFRSYVYSPQIVAYYADDDGFHAKVSVSQRWLELALKTVWLGKKNFSHRYAMQVEMTPYPLWFLSSLSARPPWKSHRICHGKTNQIKALNQSRNQMSSIQLCSPQDNSQKF